MMTKNEKIDSFKINSNGFEIITKKILCRNPISERVHMIGIIRVTFDIRRSHIKFNNLTQRIDGYSAKMHGPHLFSDGNACLGNIEADMLKLLQTAELSTLATVTVAFLESVNVEDSAGGLIVKWPLATKEELITDGYKGDENDSKKDKKGK